jgi:hypothetical protein
MECYAKAMELSPAGNQDALLRWNTCVRMLERNEPSQDSVDGGGYVPELE